MKEIVVLLVDGYRENFILTEEYFKICGVKIRLYQVMDLNGALNHLNRTSLPTHILIFDSSLIGKDTRGLLNGIKTDSRFSSVLIACTILLEEEEKRYSDLNLPIDYFILKPFTFDLSEKFKLSIQEMVTAISKRKTALG